ncbi:MAG TPA: hypothetical protein VMK66_03630 [Myxococcales bacterium]|nr:hypothetical protein [Myxococcales bacterium]
MERLGEIALYRFRVRTADGREAVSRIVATRKPVSARLGTGDEVDALKEEAEHPPMLANPRWSNDSFANGEPATLMVDAPGLDGRTVRFVVERLDGEDWVPYDTVESRVEDGVAEGSLQVAHPSPEDGDAEPVELRFTCELQAAEG